MAIERESIYCHPDEDDFPNEAGSSHGLFLMSSQGAAVSVWISLHLPKNHPSG